jgi:membrane carboxypeptidase/penicillin-binding protein
MREAIAVDIRKGKIRAGRLATITQQLARNLYLTREKTIVARSRRSSWPGASTKRSASGGSWSCT